MADSAGVRLYPRTISNYAYDEFESLQYNQEFALNQPASKYSVFFPRKIY